MSTGATSRLQRTLRRQRRQARRGGIDSVLLRQLPGDSAVHRLWIGTKLTAMAVLTVATGLNTGWLQLAAIGVLVGVVVIAARVPARAWPRVPAWFFVLILIGMALSSLGAGVGEFLRFTIFGVLFIMLSLVLCWTTDLGELAPALMRLGAPLRRLGMPVEQWALTTTLAVRSLPLILDECRVVIAARKQRMKGTDPDALIEAVFDAVTAAMSAAVRRGNDLGEVIALRGGARMGAGRRVRLRRVDVVALALVVIVSIAPSVA